MKLTDNVPLIFFDLETTGVNLFVDRIVELSVIKIMPDGSRETKTRLINPKCPSRPRRPRSTISPTRT